MKKIGVQRAWCGCPGRHRRGAEAVRGTARRAPLPGKQRSDATRPPHAPEAEMGTPVLVGAGRKGNQRPALVRAAVDLGLELRRHGIQGLLEVRVVATTVRLLEAFPGRKGAGRRRAGHVPA